MPSPKTSYWGQGLLLWLIALYRRVLRGRGPFARVRCTFEHAESCSHYGERVVREVATSVPEALRLIVRRLRRCRQAAIYHDEQRRWLWGSLYDDADALNDALERAHERRDSRAVLLQSAIIVAHACGEGRAAMEHRRQLDPVAEELRERGLPRPLARNGSALRAGQRRRLQRRFIMAMALLCFGLVAALVSVPVTLLAASLAVVIAGGALSTHEQRQRRFDQLRAAACFHPRYVARRGEQD